jgi:hypothetical protein
MRLQRRLSLFVLDVGELGRHGAGPPHQRIRDCADHKVPFMSGSRIAMSRGNFRSWLSRRCLIAWISACLLFVLPSSMLAQENLAKTPAAAQTPDPASFASPTAQHASTAGKADSFTVKADGTPTPIISVDGNLPDGVTFSAPKLSISATVPVGKYTIKFKAINTIKNVEHTASQTLTLTVKAAQTTSKAPCDSSTYTVQLRALHGVDADGLAAALNGTFDGFVAVARPPSSGSGSKQGQANAEKGNQNQLSTDSSGQTQTSQNSSEQYLCVYRLNDLGNADPNTGKLTAFIPTRPPKSIPQDERDLESVIRRLDRPEFAGIGLDARYVVSLAKIDPSALIAALPEPAPGFELSVHDAVGQFLILHPASVELPIATKAGSDLATQAAKIKRDLLALDNQYGLAIREGPGSQQVELDVAKIPGADYASTFLVAETELEQWDASHTVYLTALDPRDVALRLANILFGTRHLQVLDQQRAITIRPTSLQQAKWGLKEQRGVLVAADAVQRNALYVQAKAEHAWEQKLQTDVASNSKQGNGNSNSAQAPLTTTTSNTTISAPLPAVTATGSTGAKTASPIQIQTTTSSQTTAGSTTQGGSGTINSEQSAGANSSGNSTTSGNGGSGGNSNLGVKAGGGSGNQVAQTPETSQPLASGKIVRLYHLRQASNIATVLNAIPGTSGPPLVQALSDYGNDDLLLILPPIAGQQDNTESIRRMIVSLDEPRPTISLQVWSYEISSLEEKKPQDRAGQMRQAADVSNAYGEFMKAVQEADTKIQDAMAAGVAAAMNKAVETEMANPGSFSDPVFQNYLTARFDDCVRIDRYCLGYKDGLTFGPPNLAPPDTRTNVSLERFVVLLAAARDQQEPAMINAAITRMQDPNCQSPLQRDETSLCFDHLQSSLETLAQPRNLHQFRVALLDFLFQYKLATAYPNDFGPYYLEQSAQNLNAFLNTFIVALDRDLDHYIEGKLSAAARDATRSTGQRVGLANFGEVQVNSISGDPVNISGTVNNYFNITQPALLKDVLSGLLSGAGSGSGGTGGGQGSGGGGTGGSQGTGSGGSIAGTSGNGSGGSSTTGGSSAPGGGTSSTGAAGALASATQLLTPWQAVALNALATASAPPQLMAQVNAQTTLAVTPISLDTASAAELKISLQISNPTSTIDASRGSPSSFIRQDLANSVANYNVQTSVRVDSLKLFQVSSLSMDLTHAETAVPVPVIGWVYEAIFGTVPWMNDHILAVRRDPKTIQNRSLAVVRAVVVPTAMDVGLGMPFRADDIYDPVTETSKSLSSLGQTSNKFQGFHQSLMRCILEASQDCMTEVRLSRISEQTY